MGSKYVRLLRHIYTLSTGMTPLSVSYRAFVDTYLDYMYTAQPWQEMKVVDMVSLGTTTTTINLSFKNGNLI